MPKKIILIGVALIIIAALILLTLGMWLALSLGGSNPAAPSAYSAVYLSSGDIYFGKLSWFPNPHLSKVWLLQRQIDQNNQQQLSLNEFTKAVWSPVDELYLNRKEIIWWTYLRNDSQIAKVIDNPSLFQQPQIQEFQPPVSTETFKGPTEQPPSKK